MVGNILAPQHLPELSRFAQGNVLAGFDFDGTLAPIVDNPHDAFMPADTRRLFCVVCHLYPCIVLSGRSAADLHGRLRGLPLRAIVGNHGGDANGENYSLRVEQWKARLQGALQDRPGIWIEDKAQSLAIHYRASNNKSGARKLVWDAASQLEGARVVQAKLAINLVPANAPHKGDALRMQCERLNCDSAIFIGDDRTDEDVFAHAATDNLLGIRVGRSVESKAQYWIRDQRQVNAFLRELIRLRQP